MKRLLVALLCFFALRSTAFAWGEKGHLLSNEAATLGLPTDMPQFFLHAFPELTYLGPDPDRWYGGEAFDAVNLPDHFIDYEYARNLKFPHDRYRFLALLESSGNLRRYGIVNSTTGFLPYAITEQSELLTNLFRLWRHAHPPEREMIERDIIHVAGVLGHYVGDGANPAHTTYNFNGWVDPNPHGYATDCETHSRFERDFIDDNVELADVAPRLAAPRLRTDYLEAALEHIRASFALVERMYELDRNGDFDPYRRPAPAVAKDFAADRIAAGSSLLRDLWWSAWRNSALPKPRKSAEDS